MKLMAGTKKSCNYDRVTG